MSKVLNGIEDGVRQCRRDIASARKELLRAEGELEGLKKAHDIITNETAGIAYDVAGPLEEIEDRLRRARERRVAIRDNLGRLEGELEGLRVAREILGGPARELEDDIDDTAVARGREISTAWRKILSFFVQRLPSSLSIGDVMQFIADNDLNISRNAVRSQLHLYAGRGFLKRVGDGQYVATDAVKRVC